MTQYRLFFLNGLSGHVERAEVVEAADDAQAVEESRSRSGRQPLELWHRARRVQSFEVPPARVPMPALA